MRAPEYLQAIASVPVVKAERPSAARLELLRVLFGEVVRHGGTR